MGLLASPVQHDLVRSTVEGTEVDAALDQLRREAAEAFAGSVDIEIVTAVDCRYPGQSHEITVPTVADFHAEHEKRNGYARPDAHVEVVALRASARVASPVDIEALPSTDRAAARGPIVVSEADCTIWVPDGWKGEPGAAGALVLTRT